MAVRKSLPTTSSPGRPNLKAHRSRPRLEALEERRVPTTFTPTTFADGGAGSGSLRDAVLMANADPGTAPDTIQLQPGSYSLTVVNTSGQENQGLTGDLDITSTAHPLTIQGTGTSGASATFINASQLQDRVFQILNPGTAVTFRNMVISGGLAQDNGTAGTMPGTTTAEGGAILNNGGDLTFTKVVIELSAARGGNGADGGAGQAGGNGFNALGGGIASFGGSLTLGLSTISSNVAAGGQGGSGGKGTRHTGPGGQGGAGGFAQGGGMYTAGSALHLATASIIANEAFAGAGGQGGAGGSGFPIAGFGGPGGLGGLAQGAGLFGTHFSLTWANGSVSQNAAVGGQGGNGGAGGNPARFFTATGGPGGTGGGGGAAQGGGLYTSDGLVTLSKLSLSNNFDNGGGGGLGGPGGSASLGGNGGAGGSGGAAQGGAIFLTGGTLDMTASTIDHNPITGGTGGNGGFGAGGFTTGFSGSGGDGANGGAAQGAGLFLQGGQVTLTNDTVALNTVQGGFGGQGGTEGFGTGFGSGGNGGNGGASQGGGFYLGSGTITFTNDTFAKNQANDSLGGMGAINGNNGVGSPGQGGGVNNPSAAANALNTIFATNTASVAPDFSGNFTTATFDLIGNNAGSNLTGGTGNLIGTPQTPINPKLAPLGHYGGPTQTMALLSGSPAIDAGTATGAPATDQRGMTRGNPPDMGAFENTRASVAVPAPNPPQSQLMIRVPALPGADPIPGRASAEEFDSGGTTTADDPRLSTSMVRLRDPGLTLHDLDRLFAFADITPSD
jgi:hypothetical protein